MSFRDANPQMPEWAPQYNLVEVDIDYLGRAVKPKAFIHIDQTECILCEGCVDICPWRCIFMLSPEVVETATGTARPGDDPSDGVVFVIDDDVCTRCALCVDRCPTGVIVLGKLTIPGPEGEVHARNNNHGYGYGMRL
jgi:formate hydrogenlyase subunit 6/NADH:ubiquinone oxidoreductase subunit I